MTGHLLAADPVTDFSGQWTYDAKASNTQQIAAPQERFLTVAQHGALLDCSSTRPNGAKVRWSYDLDGGETHYQLGEERHSSKVKWERSALLVNTIVSGTQDYSTLDRWALSGDGSVLTIERDVIHGGSESEGRLVYRREGAAAVDAAVISRSNQPPAPLSIVPRTAPPSDPTEIIVRSGTHIPLSLRNSVDTKHSHEGDRVYLETLYPITVNNHIVIPRGSNVVGTVTISKAAGAVKGKGELFIRFDSIVLPNGVSRDFRSRLESADSSIKGKVDRNEGTVTGERDKSGEAKTTAEGAGIGAGIGGLAGAAAGHPLPGAGIGAAAGAAAGLASVLIRHHPDAALPKGTTVEMILDRDLQFVPSELRF